MATFYIFVLSAISVYKSTVSISLVRGAASLSWLHNPIIICLSPGSSKIFLLSPAQSWSDRRLRFQRLLQSAIFSPAPRPPPPDILTAIMISDIKCRRGRGGCRDPGKKFLVCDKAHIDPHLLGTPACCRGTQCGNSKNCSNLHNLIVCVVNITFKCLSTECDTNKE